MIQLTRLNGTEMYLNADLVAAVEERPDTVVTLVDGKHFVVTEPAAEVVGRITRYRAAVLALAEQMAAAPINPADFSDSTDTRRANGRQLYVLHGEPAGD